MLNRENFRIHLTLLELRLFLAGRGLPRRGMDSQGSNGYALAIRS